MVDVDARPLFAVRVIPRLLFKTRLVIACNAPPLKVTELAVTDPGAAPKLASELIDKMPAETLVPPL